MRRIEDALHWLAIGHLSVPPDVDPGDFIVSGGTLDAPAPKVISSNLTTFDNAVREYRGNLSHLAPSNRATIGTHLTNLKKKLGKKATGPLHGIDMRDLEAFLQARLGERSPTTVKKERVTVMEFFDWAVAMNILQASPAANLTKVKSAGDLPPFRTYQEIENTVATVAASADGRGVRRWCMPSADRCDRVRTSG